MATPRTTAAANRHLRLLQAIDVTLAFLLLMLLSPVMIGLAVAISLGSGGTSPLFGHRRYGKDGRTFLCYKFKSMAPDADARLARLLAHDPAARAEWHRDHKLRRDPRVTPIGRFIRKTSLDELPQLINVVRGEMSLVGPRPLPGEESDRIDGAALARLDVKPGITGLWQVCGRSDLTYADLQHLDSVYVRSWSLMWDVRIIAKTPHVVFARKGAY